MLDLIIISAGLNIALIVSLIILYKENYKISKSVFKVSERFDKKHNRLLKDFDYISEIVTETQDMNEVIFEYYEDLDDLKEINDILQRRYKNFEKTLLSELIEKEIKRREEKWEEYKKTDEYKYSDKL